MIDTYLDNLRRVYERATPEERIDGAVWYLKAREQLARIAGVYHLTQEIVAYAAAALSNNMEWEANVALTDSVAWAVSRGVEPRGHFPLCLEKATRILQGDLTALKGPKVEPFARALFGDMRAAVVDRWMWRAAMPEGSAHLTHKRIRDVSSALRLLSYETRLPVVVVQATIWLTIRRENNV